MNVKDVHDVNNCMNVCVCVCVCAHTRSRACMHACAHARLYVEERKQLGFKLDQSQETVVKGTTHMCQESLVEKVSFRRQPRCAKNL